MFHLCNSRAQLALKKMLKLNHRQAISPVLLLGDIDDALLRFLHRERQLTKHSAPTRIDDLQILLSEGYQNYQTILAPDMLDLIDDPQKALFLLDSKCNHLYAEHNTGMPDWLCSLPLIGAHCRGTMGITAPSGVEKTELATGRFVFSKNLKVAPHGILPAWLLCFAYCLLLFVFPSGNGAPLLHSTNGFSPTFFLDLSSCFFPTFALQSIAAFLLTWGFLRNTAGSDFRLQTACLALCLSVIHPLLYSLHPSCFAAGFFLLALSSPALSAAKATILGMGLAASSMWSWVFFPPLIALRRIYCVPFVSGVFFWLFFAGKEFNPATLAHFGFSQPGFSFSAYSPLWPLYLFGALLLVPLLSFWRKDKNSSISFLWFSLFNQAHYLAVTAPLALSFLKFEKRLHLNAWCTVCVCLLAASIHIGPQNNRRLHFPSGSLILALDTKSAALCNGAQGAELEVLPPLPPFSLRIAPALAEALQSSNATGIFDCKILETYPANFVVETTLVKPPQCLVLDSMANGYRIWATKDNPAPTASAEDQPHTTNLPIRSKQMD